ncbi:replication-associated recombination protein A [Thermosipho ferrireducens]|uniref:Replication-associated recombination protein A n=1 Tax=Thermosipho ferrireducens TaxID=2571116 RepID=A0ABX7S6A1_9BACT|nr:replication-associated recombination protein A [Thermosipho ferrireducens]QTA37356.1 replication-associated recombination protein A [Thermosipho ferrireducens]
MIGLSERLRPKNFEEIVGQKHLFGNKAILRVAIESGELFPAIFYGPPGCGKTTSLELIKKYTDYEVYHLNGAFTTVSEVKKLIEYARSVKNYKKILIFMDEIHRFNKKQQDIFLPGIEEGDYILIGATTENPYKMLNEALLSRAMVLAFKRLSNSDIKKILNKAVDLENIELNENVEEFIINVSHGDARFAINLYEVLSNIARSQNKRKIDEEILQLYTGEEKFSYKKSDHYNLISAFIKSIRGSDPDAALYYLSRMLVGGEDPRFIARRLIILASEDIGLADPTALLVATSTAYAVDYVGMPECVINLSECVIYLALAPKSNTSYIAINKAMEVARKTTDLKVPRHLLNIPDSGYQYPHDFGGFVKTRYLPPEILNEKFYIPKPIGKEKKLKEILNSLWKGIKNYNSSSQKKDE